MIGFTYSPPVISSIRLENLEVSANEAKQAAEDASLQSQIVLQQVREYRNEAEYYFTQVQQIQEGDYITTQSLSDTLGAFGFDDLANVPAAFVPVAHSHLWADITDKPAEFKPQAHLHKWADISDKPVEFEPAEHIHTWQQIAEKPGTFPPESHFHSWDEIENKPAKFNPVAHQHSWGDLTGKPGAFPPESHSHDWDTISGKPNVYHDGNSINPLDYGLGASKRVAGKSANDFTETGTFYVFSTTDLPPGMSAGHLVVSGPGNAGVVHQFFYPYSDNEVYFRKYYGGWHEWQRLHHAGNVNLNVFGGASASDVICIGFASSSTGAYFYLPINGWSNPTSITVSGLFYIVSVTGQVIDDDVTLKLNAGLSSNRVAYIEVPGLAGLTSKEPLQIRAKTNYSKIRVNF